MNKFQFTAMDHLKPLILIATVLVLAHSLVLGKSKPWTSWTPPDHQTGINRNYKALGAYGAGLGSSFPMPQDHVLERYNIKFGVNEFCWEPENPEDANMSEDNRAVVAYTFAEVIPEWLRIVPSFHCFQVSDVTSGRPMEDRFAGFAAQNSIFLEKWYLEEVLAVNPSPWSFKHLLVHEIGHFVWRQLIPKEAQQDFTALAWESHLPYSEDGGSWGWNSHWIEREDGCFVKDYARTNPNEDFAETLMYYALYPSSLEMNCPEKYDFIESQVVPRMNFWRLK